MVCPPTPAFVCAYIRGCIHPYEDAQTESTHVHHGCVQAKDGSFALVLAAFEGHVEVMRLLLQNGAWVEKALPDGSTALMIAVQVRGCGCRNSWIGLCHVLDALNTLIVSSSYPHEYGHFSFCIPLNFQQKHIDLVRLLLVDYQADIALQVTTTHHAALTTGTYHNAMLQQIRHAQISEQEGTLGRVPGCPHQRRRPHSVLSRVDRRVMGRVMS